MVRFPARTNTLPLRNVHLLAVEQLEQRRLLSINASVSNGTLILTTPNNDDFVVTADSVTQLVKVNGLNPQSGSVSLGSFNSIEVVYGAGTMLVDLRGVNSSSFPGLQGTAIHLQAAAPSAAVILPPDSDGQPTDSQLPSQDVDELAQTAFEELVLTWLQEPDEDTDPIQSDAEEQRDPFESIAVGLIGDDWAAQLGIADSADSLNASSWSEILASEDFFEAIDPIRAVDFASQTLGSNWSATHDPADLVTALENGDWLQLFADHPSIVTTDDLTNGEVDSGFHGAEDFFPEIIDLDSPVNESPANVVGPRQLSEDEVVDIAQRVGGIGSLLIGSDWSEQLNIEEITNVVRTGGWNQFLSNPTLSNALDLERVSALGEQLLGPKWAKQLGISNVENWLVDGSWRDLLMKNELARRLGSAKAQVVEDRFNQLVSEAIEDPLSPSDADPIGTLEGGQQEMELEHHTSPAGQMVVASQIPTRRIYGSQYADHIDGSNDPEEIFGEAGNDIIDGHDGDDIIHGGDDDDIIDGSEGAAADVGDDELHGDAGEDTIEGGEGNDHIFGGSDNDLIDGGEEGDTIYGGDNSSAASGDDTISGGAKNDWIYGEDGNDTIHPGNENDYVEGGAGDDAIYGGYASAGNETLLGGTGTDRFIFNSAANSADATVETLDLSGTQFSYSDPFTPAYIWTTAYSGFEAVELDTFGGDDLIRISLANGALPSSVLINGNLGVDAVVIDGTPTNGAVTLSFGASVSSAISIFNTETVTFNGGTGGSTLTVLTNYSGTDSVVVDATRITGVGSLLYYNYVSSLTVDTSAGDDAFIVNLPNTGVALPASVALLGGPNSSAGSRDNLTVVGTSNADTIHVMYSFVRYDDSTIFHDGVETVTIDGQDGNDVINTLYTAIPQLNLTGGAGRDQIVVTSPVTGSVTINGGADVDSITLRDVGTATSVTISADTSLQDRLDISNNGLTTLGPITIGAIGFVDLSHNLLTALPATLAHAKSIDVSYNSLVSLTPPQSVPFDAQTIDARYNKLMTVGGLAQLSKLATLLVYGNDPALNLMPFSGQAIDIDLAPQGLERAQTISPADWRPLMSTGSDITAYSDALDAALLKIASALQFSPIKICEYVRNSFQFEPYGGVMKGPLGTLATFAGNDWDQAGLLIALLRKAGIPAAQTRFNFGRISIPAITAMEWVGAESVEAATYILAGAGVHSVVNFSTGFSELYIDHAWAEVQLTVPGVGLQWIRMDPSWKFNEHRWSFDFSSNGTDASILSAVTFDDAAYLSPVVVNGQSTIRQELPYEFYEAAVAQALSNNPSWRGISTADLKTDGPIIAKHFTYLPGLPLNEYALYSSPVSYADYAGTNRIPDNMFHGFTISATSGATTLISPTFFRTKDVVFKPVFIDFVADIGPTVHAELRRGGSIVTSGINTPSGSSVTYTVTRTAVGESTSFLNTTRTYTRTAELDQVFTIGVQAHQISPGYLAYLQTLAEEMSFDAQHTPQELGGYLAFVINDYFYKSNTARKKIDDLTYGIPIYNGIELGASSAQNSYTSFPTHQITLVPDELRIDVKDIFQQSLSRTRSPVNDPEVAAREKLVQYNGSAQEHATLEELLNVESVSTVRVFQLAKAANQTFFDFLPGTSAATIHSSLSLSSSAEDDIVNAVNSGMKVRVHQSPVSIFQAGDPTPRWTGAAWIASSSTDTLFSIEDGILTAGGAASNVPRYFSNIPSNVNTVLTGDPVNVANGAVFEDVIDVQIPGFGIPLTFERHYDSSNTETNVALQAGLGVGWTYSYSDYLDVSGLTENSSTHRIDPGKIAIWVDSKGQKHTFTAGTIATDGTQQWTNTEGLHGHFREYYGGVGGNLHHYEFIEASGLVRRFIQHDWTLDKKVRLAGMFDFRQGSAAGTELLFTYDDGYGRRLQSVQAVLLFPAQFLSCSQRKFCGVEEGS